jgi:hypothetical protein
VRDIILDDLWWDRVDYIILFTSPIYDMLRAADTDRPTLHLVYDMWNTMIEKVKARKKARSPPFIMWCMTYSLIGGPKIVPHFIAWLIP